MRKGCVTVAWLPVLLAGLAGCSPSSSGGAAKPEDRRASETPAMPGSADSGRLPEPVAPIEAPASGGLPAPIEQPASDAAAAPASPASARLTAFGTEPFWAVDVLDGVLLWKTPENQQGTRLAVKREPTLHGERWTGRDAGHEVALDIIPGECSDGMSDRRHAYTAHWTVDGRTLQGCARPASASGE